MHLSGWVRLKHGATTWTLFAPELGTRVSGREGPKKLKNESSQIEVFYSGTGVAPNYFMSDISGKYSSKAFTLLSSLSRRNETNARLPF